MPDIFDTKHTDAEGFLLVHDNWLWGSDIRRYTGKIRFKNGEKRWYKNGLMHREDGPAIKRGEASLLHFGDFGVADVWYWEGHEGLEFFPDWALAKLGDRVI